MKFYQYNETDKRIEVYNERWYPNADKTKWYRNITTILNVIDKGYNFDEWLKNVGHNSEIIIDRAGKLGSAVHRLAERTLLGETVKFSDLLVYNEDVATSYWERYLIWCQLWKDLNEKYEVEYKPEWVEYVALSDSLEYGCTIDLITQLREKKPKALPFVADFDWKTGNSIHDEAKIQVVAGMRAFEEQTGIHIDIGYLGHIPFDRPNKKGYRLVEVENSDEYAGVLKSTINLYNWKNNGRDPKFLTLPMEVDLKYIEENEITKVGQ